MSFCVSFFFFNDTATTEIYTLSLHDALPIWRPTGGDGQACRSGERDHRRRAVRARGGPVRQPSESHGRPARRSGDRKRTRLNSSHPVISYAVFCLQKKKNTINDGRGMHTTVR